MALDRSVLAVYCYSRKVADVLVGTRKLVEKGGLAAVLIAYEGKSQPLGWKRPPSPRPGCSVSAFLYSSTGCRGSLFSSEDKLAAEAE